jgi:hypothetical protein
LQQIQLESCYREANQEIDDAFKSTTSDGIEEDEIRHCLRKVNAPKVIDKGSASSY